MSTPNDSPEDPTFVYNGKSDAPTQCFSCGEEGRYLGPVYVCDTEGCSYHGTLLCVESPVQREISERVHQFNRVRFDGLSQAETFMQKVESILDGSGLSDDQQKAVRGLAIISAVEALTAVVQDADDFIKEHVGENGAETAHDMDKWRTLRVFIDEVVHHGALLPWIQLLMERRS